LGTLFGLKYVRLKVGVNGSFDIEVIQLSRARWLIFGLWRHRMSGRNALVERPLSQWNQERLPTKAIINKYHVEMPSR